MGCAGSKANDPDDPKAQGGDGDGEDEGDYSPLTQEEVNARIQCSDGTLRYELGKTGISLRYAYLSQRGYYPEDLYKANQDAFKVVPAFNGDQNQILFGVFDGHGVDGDSCSYFVLDNVEETLKQLLAKYPNDFERAYKDTFVAINMKMHEQVSRALADGGTLRGAPVDRGEGKHGAGERDCAQQGCAQLVSGARGTRSDS